MANRCFLVIWLGLTALSAGCGEAPSAGKVFTLNNGDEPETLDPTLSYAYQLFYVKNAGAFNAGTITDFAEVGVKATDDRTLHVRLESATPFFLELCSFPTLAPVHRRTVETHGDKWTRPGNCGRRN